MSGHTPWQVTLDDLLSLVRARAEQAEPQTERGHCVAVACAFADLSTCAPQDRARYAVALAAAALAWGRA